MHVRAVHAWFHAHELKRAVLQCRTASRALDDGAHQWHGRRHGHGPGAEHVCGAQHRSAAATAAAAAAVQRRLHALTGWRMSALGKLKLPSAFCEGCSVCTASTAWLASLYGGEAPAWTEQGVQPLQSAHSLGSSGWLGAVAAEFRHCGSILLQNLHQAASMRLETLGARCRRVG